MLLGARDSLRRDLFLRVAGLVLPALAIVILVHWVSEVELLRELYSRSLQARAGTLATLVTVHDGNYRVEFADEFMPQYSRSEEPFYFQLWRSDGTVLERSVSLGGADLPYQFGDLDNPASFNATLPSGEVIPCVGMSFPTRLGTGTAGDLTNDVVVVVGADSSVLASILRRGALEVLVSAAISTAAIAFMVLVALRHGVRVVERVGAEVKALARNSAERLDESNVPLEMRPVVASLNKSLDAMRLASDRERRFNRDVAHELRTPIAELALAVDLVTDPTDVESVQRLVRHTEGIASQMSSLVESLLHVARLEAGLEARGPETFDLAAAVRLHLDQASREFERVDDALYEGPDSLDCSSFPALWDVVVRNLMVNAFEYSPPDSSVLIQLSDSIGGLHLVVSNEPLRTYTDEEMARCKDRLWRGTPGRNALNHSGLGLSIVQAATEQLECVFDVHYARGRFVAEIRESKSSSPS